MMKVNDIEAELLKQIARKSGLDCWFSLRYSKLLRDYYIYDLENRKPVRFKRGLYELNDGLTDVDLDNLHPIEQKLYHNILIRHQIL